MDSHHALKINIILKYTTKSPIVNLFKSAYNNIMKPYINQIHTILTQSSKTIAVAESCTGGLLSALLTEKPGSSKYFILGVIAYNNSAKKGILRIPQQIIIKNGAVSKEIAQKMAQSVRTLAKTDFGIGITGIAGPTGATAGKPIGTVFIAVSAKNKLICRRFQFKGTRLTIRKTAALKALELLNTSL